LTPAATSATNDAPPACGFGRTPIGFARGPQQPVNRVVDIGATLDAKRAAIHACRTMVTNMLRGVNASLAAGPPCFWN
jgi:hypothetical protein